MSTMLDQQFKGALAALDAHLVMMLGWLDRLLAWHIDVTRHTYGALADDEYRGLYVPDAEADVLATPAPSLPHALVARRAELQHERDAIEAWAQAAEQDGTTPPLRALARLFALTPFERDVLLLALAPEIEGRYERIFAFVQDDVTKKRPSVDLALRLLCVEPAERLAARTSFSPHAPLLQHYLVRLFEDGQRQSPLLAHYLKLDDRITAELLCGHIADRGPQIDPLLAAHVTLAQPTRSLDSLVLPASLATQLQHAVTDRGSGLVLALHGGYGSGRRAIAEALCSAAGRPLLGVDLDTLRESDLQPREAMQRVLREATLHGAAILWQNVERVLHDDAPSMWRRAVAAALDEHAGINFLPLEQTWEARGSLRRNRFVRVALPMLSYAEREQLWRLRLNGDAPPPETLQALASTFRLTGGQIRDAVVMARSLARWRGDAVVPEDFYAACRAQSSGKLHSLAHKITATYGWNDIVLPNDQLSMLREICVQVRHRRTVLEQWGFDHHLAMGKGLNVLFAGQSGTGKTMAAEIIATDLGLELYKVDLSTMVSKYIGETEKNLDRVFTAAREANAILFFDEADALFGKRSEVKDAHDRYANIEVGYLLQKMEEYDGVVILATNLRKNLDDAFVRRLHLAIDFPFPEEADRLHIWRKVFPSATPLADDVDLPFLARRFKLAGGNIRNIALLAAYLAAEDRGELAMVHLVRAIKREYQKLGKLVTEAEFGVYLRLIRE